MCLFCWSRTNTSKNWVHIRKFGSKTAQMETWAHYWFRQRLTFKCRQFGCKVVVVNEAYNSKTCSCCGNVKWNLGGADMYKCRACGEVMGRDVNGAKNIFLRNHEALGISVSSNGAYPLLRGVARKICSC